MTRIVAPRPEEDTSRYDQSVSRLLTYLSTKARDDGTFSAVSMADSAAPNNSLYYSTTGTSLAYKNSVGGVVYLSGGAGMSAQTGWAISGGYTTRKTLNTATYTLQELMELVCTLIDLLITNTRPAT